MTWSLIPLLILSFQLTWHEHYERGEKRFTRGEYASCIQDMMEAVAERPESRQNQFTRAVQKIEYKPYYYLALAHHALDDLPQAFDFARKAYDGEVVGENPSLQSDLAPILEAYRNEVEALHGQITREEQLIAERARLIGLLARGESEQVRLALGRVEEPDRFRDIQMYLTLRDDVRDQMDSTQQEVVGRIEDWLDRGEAVKARALFDGVRAMLEPDVGDLLARQIRTAEERALAAEEAAADDPVEEVPEVDPIDPAVIAAYREQLASAESQKRNLDQQVSRMREQNQALRRELAAKPEEPDGPDLASYEPRVFMQLEPEGRQVQITAQAISPVPLNLWELTLDDQPVTLDGNAVSREGAELKLSHHLRLATYGTHRIELTVEDTLGRVASINRTLDLPQPWYLDRLWWWMAGALAAVFLVIRLAIFAGRRRRARLRHFNPYVAGHPVRNDDMFYGRDALLHRIQGLVHKNSFMIHGNRRIGKTSLLLQLSRNLAGMQSSDYVFYPVYLDFQGINEEDLFHHMMAELLAQAEEWGISLAGLQFRDVNHQYQSRHFSRDIKHLIQRLQDKHKRHVMVVLLMDEVDVLNEFGEKTNQKLRGIFMKDFAEHLTCVMAGIHLKKEWESSGSPWYNFFEEIPVRQIDEAEARRLILEPVQGIFRYRPDAVDLIVKETAGHPYLIQKLCVSLIGEKLGQSRFVIEREDVLRTLEHLQEEKVRSKG